jgi:hypothetical protein
MLGSHGNKSGGLWQSFEAIKRSSLCERFLINDEFDIGGMDVLKVI